jgi:hypothetical protein
VTAIIRFSRTILFAPDDTRVQFGLSHYQPLLDLAYNSQQDAEASYQAAEALLNLCRDPQVSAGVRSQAYTSLKRLVEGTA